MCIFWRSLESFLINREALRVKREVIWQYLISNLLGIFLCLQGNANPSLDLILWILIIGTCIIYIFT